MKVISISGVIGWEIFADEIRKQLNEAAGEDVRVEISSPGGFVFEGLAIFNLIRNYAGNVTTHLMGLAASMASYIALAGKRVTAEDNAVYMIHNVSALAAGDHKEMRKTADTIDKLSGLLAKQYAKKTGKGIDAIRKMMDDETYLYGDEMKKAGFVDEIIGSEKEKDRDTDVLTAMARVEECINVMKKSDKCKGDLEKAAACIGFTSENIEAKTNNGESNMNKLMKFLSECAEAKAEFDKAVQEARDGVSTEYKNRSQKIANFMTGKAYGPAMVELAMKVLKGESEIATLEGAATILDAQAEAAKATQAAAETAAQGHTPASTDKPGGREDGMINSEADFQAEIAKKKAEKARS